MANIDFFFPCLSSQTLEILVEAPCQGTMYIQHTAACPASTTLSIDVDWNMHAQSKTQQFSLLAAAGDWFRMPNTLFHMIPLNLTCLYDIVL